MIQLGQSICSILIEFGIPMNQVRLIKICLNETYSKLHNMEAFF
jgi:hypothetical protein